jgi:hypothetical protein
MEVELLLKLLLFLQVLTLSDISAADGTTILPNYVKGIPSLDRINTLKWPTQSKPPVAAWTLWKIALAHISTNETLPQWLGQWTNIPHQKWSWYHHNSKLLVYQLSPDGEWLEYYPVVHTTGTIRTTRQTKDWYSLNAHGPSNPNPSLLLPATTYQDPLFNNHLFYATCSSNAIPTTSPQDRLSSLWDLDDSLHILADTPEFYQRLLGPLPNLHDQIGLEIAHQLELETLLACSD